MTTEEILRKQVTDLEGQLEELRDEYDLMRENAAGDRLDARNIQGKFEAVCKQMWAALNSCIEDGTKYLGVAMPDIKRQLVHLGVLEGSHLEEQQAVSRYSREREDRIRFLTNLVSASRYAVNNDLEQIKQMEEAVDACEAANAKHLARIDQLEQLCSDLYLIYMEEFVDYAGFTARMNDLGLAIEGRTRVGR